MKILHFIWSANFGGIEKLVLGLAVAQMKGNTSPHILIGCKKGELLQSISESGAPFTFAGFKSGFDFSNSKYRKVLQIMKEHDIVHLHTFNPLIAWAAIRSGRKILYTVHGNFNLGRSPGFNDHVMNLLRSLFLKRTDVWITFNSSWAKEMAVKKYGLGNKRQTVIYNGLLPENATDTKSETIAVFKQQNADNFIIGTACRFNHSKSVDRLVRAFAEFSRGKDDTRLLLVGDGSERQHLEELVDKLKIREKTIFTGFSPEVGKWQDLMNICVIPGRFEAFGLAALETMQKGIPTFIFNDAGGMLEVLGNDLSEYVMKSESELSANLERYYIMRRQQDESRKNMLQQRAGIFSFERMVSNYQNCYRDLMQNSNHH